MEKFRKLVLSCVRNNVSDLHLRAATAVAARKNGQLHFQRDIVFSAEELDLIIASLTTDRQRHILAERWSVDFSARFPEAQMRLNAFRTADGLGLAIRFLPSVVPRFEDLNLHPSLRELCAKPFGLILICGPTGNGKSTTIAAMLREINETRPTHVVTLEDPIEYRFVSDRSLIDQRELGAHFPSFEQGLQDVLREDADVIVVGELRDPETIRLTVNAAESGHLVIATLHAATAEEALLRLCNAFAADAQDFVRSQLASCLAAVVVQHLEYLPQAGFRVPVLSIATSAPSLRNIIRENRFNQIENILQAGRAEGMFTFERYRQEFLEAKPRLSPPSLAFRASGQLPPPIAPATAPAAPAPLRATPPPEPFPSAQPTAEADDHDRDKSQPYRIDDAISLEELVAQMHGKTP